MRIGILTHYYAPEVGAPQTRLRATAALLAERGHDVSVVTGPPHYPTGMVAEGYRAITLRRDQVDGIPVLRLPVFVRPNAGFLNRMVDQATFTASSMALVATRRRWDVLVVESPPLFLGMTARLHRALSGRPYLFHVADPWPDYPIALGALRGRLPIAAATWLERFSYGGAGLITTVTQGLVRRLDAKPAATGRVRLLPNGVDIDRFDPNQDPADARRNLGWPEAKLTLAYVGTVGLAQGVRTLLDAMDRVRDADVVAHIIGDGVDRMSLQAEARDRGLTSVRFHSPVASRQVPALLAAADALVVMLRDGPLYDESLPTKLVEGLAAGRPVIASAGGEAAGIVQDAGGGFVAAAEDAGALASQIRACLNHPRRRDLGLAARRYAEHVFDRRQIVGQLETYLVDIAQRSERL